MSAASLGFQIPNQPVGIPDQLKAGIRGFLIDTHYGRRMPDGTVATDTDVLVGRARACRTVRGLLATIVAVDQFGTGGLFAAVRQLNGLPPASA
jgi:hypothetical protein